MSGKQYFVATSTMEAQFFICFEATIQSLWLRIFDSSLQIIDSIGDHLRYRCENIASVIFLLK